MKNLDNQPIAAKQHWAEQPTNGEFIALVADKLLMERAADKEAV